MFLPSQCIVVPTLRLLVCLSSASFSILQRVNDALYPCEWEVVYTDHDVDLAVLDIAFCCASHKFKCNCEDVCYVDCDDLQP